VASLGWVTPGHPRPFFSRQFCRVTPGFFFFAHCCHYHYRILLLSLGCYPPRGCHPKPFYLSDLVSPLFSVNLPTTTFPSGVTPSKSVTRGGAPSPPPPFPLMTPLLVISVNCTFSLDVTAEALRVNIENRHFRSNCVSLTLHFRQKGSPPPTILLVIKLGQMIFHAV